ncbi:hypothetical protein [Falsigemmobacter faecalis]|uniref:Uncharacterized protein n=1 Tax=Falsigemmobacter faecalis TaxID=2488730 RepID=A0A3P3DPZ0_9RHOB|nr:hypothetical protein [Falsigemmobacter faecalis]RRH76300.1 hypothetical protein EG244_05950 [Falsigemmobacter faecalis]
MEAIVLARSSKSQAYILWCEDQGALAILPLSACGREMPKVGDLLHVVLQENGPARICSSFSIVAPGALPEIAQILTKVAGSRTKPKRENRVYLSLVAPV